ncbi:Ribonuclease VapC [Gammaproteobacteria bacterium]
MNFLVDTNAISELRKRHPGPSVLAWFSCVPEERLYLSVLSVGEIRRGIEKLGKSEQRSSLLIWLERELIPWFGKRLLPVDLLVAERWGRLLAETGRSLPAVDSLLAATALVHGLTIVTRNTSDFDLPGVPVLNPWEIR